MRSVQLNSWLAILLQLGCLLTFLTAESTNDEENTLKLSFRLSSPVCPRAPQYICDRTSIYRSINGACNNLQQPWWGQSNSPYKRLLSPQYDDGLTEPRTRSASRQHSYLPNARTVANDVFDDSSKPDKASYINLLLPYFAQLVAYDISATAPSTDRNGRVEKCRCNSRDRDCFNIPIPRDDKVNMDQKCMSLVRSLASVREFDCNLGPREQLNKATHWLDLSVLYGNTQEQANNLRTFTGGLLKSYNNTRTGELYFAFNQTVVCKYNKYAARYYDRERCYTTGDSRTEDNAILTSLLTIFLREHNRIANELSTVNPLWNDERIYQEARRIVIAIYQNIVYSEFLPAVIGIETSISFGLPTLKQGYFTKYSPSIYPQVSNEFATAASRFFHTMLPLDHTLIGRNKQDKVTKSISFFQFNNQLYEKQMTPLLRGLLTDKAHLVKPSMNKYLQDWLWNELFYDEDTKRWSLSALNIQQGRDHGLPGYNSYRRLCGLREAKSFNDLTNIPEKTVQRLRAVYKSVDDIDLFVGLVSEKPLKQALVGQTAACIIGKQFRDLKFGDRFYFETSDPVGTNRKRSVADLLELSGPARFSPQQLSSIRSTSLGQIIAQNTDISSVQSSVFSPPDSNTNPAVSQTNIDLSGWSSPDGLYINCASSFTYNSTQAYFYYSPSNSSTDLASFSLQYSDYASTGLSQSSIDFKCFPLNRTAVVTITGNKATTNLDMGAFVANAQNASILIYIFNVNSVYFASIDSNSYDHSTLSLSIANVQSLVQFKYYVYCQSYDFSSTLLLIDSAGKAYFVSNNYFYAYDNSSMYHSVNNVTNMQVDAEIQLYNYKTSDENANNTICNNTAVYSNIKEALLTEIYGQWEIGAKTHVLIENVDNLRLRGTVQIFSSNNAPNSYINIHCSFIVRNIGQLYFGNFLRLKFTETYNFEMYFENIKNFSGFRPFYAEFSVTDEFVASNSSLSFRKINYMNLDFDISQTSAGKMVVEFVDIITLEISSFVATFQSLGSIDFRANLTQLSSVNITQMKVSSLNDSQTAFNFGQISQRLDVSELIVDKSCNSTALMLNLSQIPIVNIGTLNGTLDGPVKANLFSVASTVINAIPATINLATKLLFSFFGQTNFFVVVNDPAGAGSTVKTYNDTSCSCLSVERY